LLKPNFSSFSGPYELDRCDSQVVKNQKKGLGLGLVNILFFVFLEMVVVCAIQAKLMGFYVINGQY
jgi:hypothetical protein